MSLTWTDDLSIGFGLIDEQHQTLFARYNDLLLVCLAGKGREAIIPTLDFLAEYVEKHFAEEERFMDRYDYPDREGHRQEHFELCARVAALRRDLQENGPSAAIVSTINHTLIHWLINHVKQVDMRLGRFLADKTA